MAKNQSHFLKFLSVALTIIGSALMVSACMGFETSGTKSIDRKPANEAAHSLPTSSAEPYYCSYMRPDPNNVGKCQTLDVPNGTVLSSGVNCYNDCYYGPAAPAPQSPSTYGSTTSGWPPHVLILDSLVRSIDVCEIINCRHGAVRNRRRAVVNVGRRRAINTDCVRGTHLALDDNINGSGPSGNRGYMGLCLTGISILLNEATGQRIHTYATPPGRGRLGGGGSADLAGMRTPSGALMFTRTSANYAEAAPGSFCVQTERGGYGHIEYVTFANQDDLDRCVSSDQRRRNLEARRTVRFSDFHQCANSQGDNGLADNGCYEFTEEGQRLILERAEASLIRDVFTSRGNQCTL